MRTSLLFMLCLLLGACSAPPSTRVEHEELMMPVGDFSLTERSGKKVSQDDLKGKVWVASFVFTRCTGPCPQVTATMARLQKELAEHKDNVRLVTFTVDPDRDDPMELTKYAGHFRADPERWLFLTGTEKQIHSLLEERFKVPVEKNEKATPGNEFNHSSKLVVVDRKGNIRGYFDGVQSTINPDAAAEEYEQSIKSLREKVNNLLKEE